MPEFDILLNNLITFTMRTFVTVIVLVSLCYFYPSESIAQKGKTNKISATILTSAVCGMCKERIETAMAYHKGIIEAELDVKTKILSFTYNPKQTDLVTIKKLISLTGYDADEVPADPRAYEKLPPCCKKDAPPH
jgi:periplasmic mercuric ion binding protein